MTEQVARWKGASMAFYDDLVLPDGRRFGEAMAPFQRRDFEGIERHRYSLLERPRGASKTTDVAAVCDRQLFLGPPNGRVYACAVDRDQAALLHEAAVGWISRTPLLARSVEVERWKIRVKATGTMLEVLAADAASSWGLAPTFVVCDELAMWSEWQGEELWTSLWTSTGKRGAKVVCITTPGWDRSSLAWRVREMAQTAPAWYVSTRQEPAPWIPVDWLEEQRKSLPAHTFARLHLGQWTDAGGAFLSGDEVAAIFTDDLPAVVGPAVVGVDLGVSRDAAVAALVRKDLSTGLTVLEHLVAWQPRRGQKVDLRDVRQEVTRLAKRAGAEVVVEEWQGLLMAAELRSDGVSVTEYKPSAQAFVRFRLCH